MIMVVARKIREDPIVEKVKREGLFGTKLSEVDLSRPFERMKPNTATTPGIAEDKAIPNIPDLNKKLLEVSRNKDASYLDIMELVQKGAQLDACDDDGNTPLHLAMENYSSDAAGALIEAGANTVAQNDSGHTPLHVAVKVSYDMVTQLMLQPGKNVDARDNQWTTPLMHAARHGSRATVELLLKLGADVNATDYSGETAIMHAAYTGNADAMRGLLSANAAYHSMRNSKGKTALDIAKLWSDAYKVPLWHWGKKGLSDCILELRKHGAVEETPLTKWEMLNMPLRHLYYYMKHKK